MSDSCGGAIEDSDDSRDRVQPYAPLVEDASTQRVTEGIYLLGQLRQFLI